MDKYVGKKLDGRYEIRELIGIGGMANVYRCYDTVDDREVAIKILKDEYLNNEEFIRRFKNESKAIAVLSHPNIVKVYDVSFGDMIQYIVMEYIDGITLKEYINQQGILTWKETVHLITQILKALSHAHSKGVVHRDIKPQNMMLLADGTIKVTDFGIARFSNSTRTMTEQAIGSVHYIAPEQAKGDITDGKTDIYSLGVMMYEMLTGRLPFDGDNAVSVALMHLQVTPDTPRSINPSIPEGIEEITVKAMQKQPLDRYQSAQDMLEDIERFRMNPSVKFEYKYFSDKQHTKFMNAVNKGKTTRAEEFANTVYGVPEEKVRHSIAFPIIVGIIIALCLAVAICIPYGIIRSNRNNEVNEIMVPSVVGMTEEEARTKYKFEFEVSTRFVDGYKYGEIIQQDPPAGSRTIKENGKISITVCRSESEKIIPPVYGLTESKASTDLRNAGFTYIYPVYVQDSSVESDTVVGSYPEEGKTVSVSQKIILFVASKNADSLVTIPNVIGLTKEEADEALTKANLKANFGGQAMYCEYPEGTVYHQIPAGGKVNKGSEIVLCLSLGPFPLNTGLSLPANAQYPIEVVQVVGNDVSEPKYAYSSDDTQLLDVEVSGRGEIPVKIYLDGNLYFECRVDLKASKVVDNSARQYNYISVVETQPVTETEPEPVVTEPTMPSETQDVTINEN